MCFKESGFDKLHLGTWKAVFMEPREYDMDRHKTKSNFKRQLSKVINRELWAASGWKWVCLFNTCPFPLQPQLWLQKDAENPTWHHLCQEGHSNAFFPQLFFFFLNNVHVCIFNTCPFKSSDEIRLWALLDKTLAKSTKVMILNWET